MDSQNTQNCVVPKFPLAPTTTNGTIKSASRAVLIFIVPLLMLLTALAYSPPALAAVCKEAALIGHGSATSEKKAKRNARLDVKSKIERQYPGDSKRHMSDGIGYKCEKSVLWLCQAKVMICQ